MKRLDASRLDSEGYRSIARVLSSGGIVCMPTDTIYGLAVDATDPAAIERLYRLKGRPPSRPVILLVVSIDMARSLTRPPPSFDALAGRFWPGPITFVLVSDPRVSPRLTAGTGTIALRWPASELAVRIVRELGRPITSTSANRSGEPPALSGEAAAASLEGIDLVVDQGRVVARPPSTLVDLTVDPPVLLREGPVPFEDVVRFLSGRSAERSA